MQRPEPVSELYLDSKFVMILRSKSHEVANIIAHFLTALTHFFLSISSQRCKEKGEDFMIFLSSLRSVKMAATHGMAATRALVQSVIHPTSQRFTLPLRLSVLRVNTMFNFHSSPSMLKNRYAPKNFLLEPGCGEYRHVPCVDSDIRASYCLLEVYSHYDLCTYMKITHLVRSSAVDSYIVIRLKEKGQN